jgi:UDP-2,4-diacetamido-2,4,6-trideoxy-beta-L-altropyranose hydrolase
MSSRLVVIRAEGGQTAGLGHVRRCLTLGSALERHECRVEFVVTADGCAGEFIRREGFSVATVSSQEDLDLAETVKVAERLRADVLVVDTYEVRHFDAVGAAGCVVVLDDVADRALLVDMVVNGTIGASHLRYRTLPQTRLLLGTEYLLLREEYCGGTARAIRPEVQRVLITVGGMDPCGLTPRLIEWMRQTLSSATIEVVAGPFFSEPLLTDIEMVARRSGMTLVHRAPTDLRDLMLFCDLAVTGGGQTTYELAATGTPAVAIRMAENQTLNLEGLAARGALRWTGDAQDPGLRDALARTVTQLASDLAEREAMSRAARGLIDGKGADRVAQAIVELKK